MIYSEQYQGQKQERWSHEQWASSEKADLHRREGITGNLVGKYGEWTSGVGGRNPVLSGLCWERQTLVSTNKGSSTKLIRMEWLSPGPLRSDSCLLRRLLTLLLMDVFFIHGNNFNLVMFMFIGRTSIWWICISLHMSCLEFFKSLILQGNVIGGSSTITAVY